MDPKRIHPEEKVDFTGWEFADGKFGELAAEEVAKAIEEQLVDDPPWISLPTIWTDDDGNGGPPVTDPLTIYITLPLGKMSNHGDAGGPMFSFTLREFLEQSLEEVDGNWSNDDAALLLRVENDLRSLADWLRDKRTEIEKTMRDETVVR